MDDPELEAIRQRRMQELMAQNGMRNQQNESQQKAQEDAKREAEERRQLMLSQILSVQARERRPLQLSLWFRSNFSLILLKRINIFIFFHELFQKLQDISIYMIVKVTEAVLFNIATNPTGAAAGVPLLGAFSKDSKSSYSRESCFSSHLCKKLRQRAQIARIALVKPDKARGVEDVILRSAQMGQITEKVSEERLISLLEQINTQTTKQTKVTIQRRRSALEDDD